MFKYSQFIQGVLLDNKSTPADTVRLILIQQIMTKRDALRKTCTNLVNTLNFIVILMIFDQCQASHTFRQRKSLTLFLTFSRLKSGNSIPIDMHFDAQL